MISEALPLSSNTIRIHWLTPRPVNGILQFYELQYSEINGDVDLKPLVLRIRPDQNNRTISDLVIFTGYVFSLRASTGDRMDLLWSNWSSPVMVKTLEGGKLGFVNGICFFNLIKSWPQTGNNTHEKI